MTGPERTGGAADDEPGSTGCDNGISASETCRNCGTVLRGRFCHGCGQSADLRKRNVFRLFAETVSSVLNYDNRLLRTLSLLFLRPGVLAKDMIEGRIARHTPPLQTYVFSAALFVLMFTYALQLLSEPPPPSGAVAVTSNAPGTPAVAPENTAAPSLEEVREGLMTNWGLTAAQADALARGILKGMMDESAFLSLFAAEFGRFLICILPILALTLKVMYLGRRDVFLHDHFYVACYLSSSILLPGSVVVPFSYPLDLIGAIVISIWNAATTYQVLKTGYGSSRTGAFLKMIALWLGTLATLLLLVVGVFIRSVLQL